jgi:hypothetical protein
VRKKGPGDEVMCKYREAVKSAKTKFDHCEEYYRTDGNPLRYINLI